MKIHLNKDTVITKTELNKITQKLLEDNIVGETAGGEKFSQINGIEYMWNYRKQDGIFNPVCQREDANQITIYSNIDGNINVIKTIYLVVMKKKGDVSTENALAFNKLGITNKTYPQNT